MAKRGKKKTSKKKSVKKKVSKKPVKKQSSPKKIPTRYNFGLSTVSIIVLIAYILSTLMLRFVDGTLTTFSYLTLLVLFIISLFGVALSAIDLFSNPQNKASRKTLYINLIVLAIAFVFLLLRIL